MISGNKSRINSYKFQINLMLKYRNSILIQQLLHKGNLIINSQLINSNNKRKNQRKWSKAIIIEEIIIILIITKLCNLNLYKINFR